MFENLTDKLSGTLRRIGGNHKLNEANIDEALKDVRTALLEADVHVRVVREFTESVKTQALGEAVLKSVSPGQQMVKVINDALVNLLGSENAALKETRPLRILLVGLQGSGKTTTAGKLARKLKKDGKQPALIACDIYRPAAIDQLETLAQAEDVPFYAERDNKNVPSIAASADAFLRKQGANVLLFDTAGRLQLDATLIDEVKRLKAEIKPDEILLVADAALGQEAVNIAGAFNTALGLTGLVLTKLDGDARGGAALSMKHITGVPIKFIGTGEGMDALEAFHPDRLAQRILGMGDVVSLVEKAQEHIDEDEAERMAQRMARGEIDFEDMLSQLRSVKKMGSLGSVMKMIPGMSGLNLGSGAEKQMERTEAIILSMTRKERQKPKLIDGSRRIRIAKGSGTQVSEVNTLVKQHATMQKMMKKMKGKKGKANMEQMMAQMGGGMPGAPMPGAGANMPDLSALLGGKRS